jgi:hypothetical protein
MPCPGLCRIGLQQHCSGAQNKGFLKSDCFGSLGIVRSLPAAPTYGDPCCSRPTMLRTDLNPDGQTPSSMVKEGLLARPPLFLICDITTYGDYAVSVIAERPTLLLKPCHMRHSPGRLA